MRHFFTILILISIAAIIGPAFITAETAHAQPATGTAEWRYEVIGQLPTAGDIRPGDIRDVPTLVRYVFLLGLGLSGILAFGMIVFAGLEWALSGANPSLQSDAMDRIRNAIFGLLLLLGAYVILNTINPDLVSLRAPQGWTVPPPGTGPVPQTHTECRNNACVTVQGAGVNRCHLDADCLLDRWVWARMAGNFVEACYTQRTYASESACRNSVPPLGYDTCVPIGACPPPRQSCNEITPQMCSNQQSIAAACNARYPRGNSPTTDQLIACVRTNFQRPLGQGGFGRPFGGTVYTYEVSRDVCNYTKGREVCGSCAHTTNSCHYGGSPTNPSGNQGALAIDWGLAWLSDAATRAVAANAVIQSGQDCGSSLFKSAFCDSGGRRVPCIQASHVHMAVAGCDRD